MILTKLDIDLLKILINHKKVTLDQASEFLSTSIINTRKSIFRLKTFLNDNLLGDLSNKKTIYTLKIDKDFFNEGETIQYMDISSSERFYCILWELVLTREINLTKLAQKFDINRTSLNLDMKRIKKILKKYDLGINSLPWKGINITGNSIDIHIFSIKLIFKFLLEKEFNQLSWDLYGVFINPIIKGALDQYIIKLNNEFSNLEKLRIEIADSLDIAVGTYAYTYIEAVLLYLVNFEENIEEINLKDIKNFPKELKNEFLKIFNKFSKIKDLIDHHKINNKISLLTYSLINLDKKFFETIINKDVSSIKNIIEKKYRINLSLEDDIMLNVLIRTMIFKYDFNIIGFNNYYLGEIELPNKLIKDMKKIFNEINVNILNEDYYVIALYIYQLISNQFKEYNYKNKIIIIDSSINNWVGRGFKNEILKYIPSMNITIKTIYKIEPHDFEEADYFLFTYFIDKNQLLRKYPKYKDKIYLISYKNYFQINNFLDTLLFREEYLPNLI